MAGQSDGATGRHNCYVITYRNLKEFYFVLTRNANEKDRRYVTHPR